MRERSIFIAALEKDDPVQRTAYLDEVCGADATLRQRIEELLRAHAAAGGILDQPPLPPDDSLASDSRYAPTVTPQPGPERVGSKIGPYKLLQQIGEGGMGTVWMAEQTEPVRRMVAIKIIKPGMDSSQVIARFEAERQALAVMDHPNIARVLDAGTSDAGRPFFVMELVKGVPITQFCDEQRLSPRERLELLVPVCQAIQHAHHKGIIHRDIKPSNVLVATYDGRPVPKVIDFGVAKAMGQKLTERTLFTGFGGIVGTLEYMSPEQAEFNALDIDTRSDIYSLGVLLYELLTGTTPLTKQRLQQTAIAELLRAIREDDPPRPSTRLSESKDSLASISAQRRTEPGKLPNLVRGELDWIVMKALEKDRLRRYETANAFARDIERYLGDESVEACPPSVAYRLRKFARKHKTSLVTAAFVLLLVVAGAGVSVWQAVRATKAEEIALQNELRANTEAASALANARRADAKAAEATANEKLARDAKLLSDRRLYAANMNLAQRAWNDGHIERLIELLEGQRPEHTDGADLRGFEWHYWDRLRHGDLQTIQTNAVVNSVAFSFDGKQLASGGEGTAVTIWDARTGQRIRTFAGHTGEVRSVAFSPDGVFLASAANDQLVKVWNASSGEEMRSVLGPHANFNMVWLAFSEDGRTLVAESPVGTAAWNVTTGEPATPPKTSVTMQGNALSPDRQRQAVLPRDGTGSVQIQSVLAGHTLSLKGHSMPATDLSFSADGRRLASGSFDGTIRIWDALTGIEPLTFTGPSDRVLSVAFDQTGNRLAAGSRDGSVTIWDADTGQVHLTLNAHKNGGVQSVAFNSDGTRLASASWDGTAKVWDVTTGDERFSITGHTVAFSPDGKRLATASPDRTVKLWEAATGLARFTLRGHQDAVNSVAFSSDGMRVASGSNDGTVRLWDAVKGTPLRTFKLSKLWVRSVAFSPDGKRLAAGIGVSVFTAGPGEIQVWDLVTETKVFSLKGHHDAVTSVAFSPDGKRLASGTQSGWNSLDPGEVKVWELNTGQESLTLHGHTGAVSHVAFSPDGLRLASASHDLTVKVWDARPWTAALRVEQQAISVLRFLVARPLAKGDILATIRRDEAISDAVRQKALDLSERFREETDPQKYHAAAWNSLRNPYANRFQTAVARMQAATACRLQPDNGLYQTGLGVAQYRVGEHDESLKTLARAAELNAKHLGGPHPADLAFRAMAHHRLDHKDESLRSLEALRELLARERWKNDAEAQSMVREAEALIVSSPALPGGTP